MKRELIEDFLFSELAEVKGGQASKDCHCSSGAAETIIVVPIEEIEKLCSFVEYNPCIVCWTITPAFYSENKKDYNRYSVDNDNLVKVLSYLGSANLFLSHNLVVWVIQPPCCQKCS